MSKKRPIKEDDDDNVSMFSDEDLLEIGKDGIGGHAAAGRNDVVAAAADKQAAVNKQRENAAVNAIKRRRIPAAAASDDDDDDNTSVITEVSVTGPQIIRLADFPLIGGGGGGFFLFCVEGNREQFIDKMNNYICIPIEFDFDGSAVFELEKVKEINK